MARWWVVAIVGLAGCQQFRFDTVEEACPDKLAGQSQLVPGTEGMLMRIACYRRFEGLAMPRITKGAQDASDAHAHYLEVNGVMDPESPNAAKYIEDYFFEQTDWPGFTGADAIQRLIHFQAIDTTASFGLWDVLLPDGGTDVADDNVADPYTRDVIFQPLWYSVGYAVVHGPEVNNGYFTAVYGRPPQIKVVHPIVFPRDGQTEVPASYATYGVPEDPLSVVAVSGYPITVTVGAYEIAGGQNVYDLHPVTAKLVGEEGELSLIVVPPGSFPWGPTLATIIYAPSQPLIPGNTYDFDATIRWNAYPNGKDIHSTFTVASDGPTPGEARTAKKVQIR